MAMHFDSGMAFRARLSAKDCVPCRSGSIACPIPASAMHNFGKVPPNGYLLLLNPDQFTCSTYAWDAAPTACGSPVDGFAKTFDDPACCVNVLPFVPGNGNPNSAKSAYVEAPSLILAIASTESGSEANPRISSW